MKRFALLLPILALAAAPARAEDPATNAPAAVRRGVFFFPDGIAVFRGGLQAASNSTYSVQGAVLGFADVPRRMDGVQLDLFAAGAECVNGIQIGLGAVGAAGSARGLVAGGMVAAADDMVGIEVAGIFGIAKRLRGVQLAMMFGFAGGVGERLKPLSPEEIERDVPVSWGAMGAFFSTSSVRFRGVQAAVGASASEDMAGLLVGGLGTRAGRLRGVQAGLVFDDADSLEGLQIGLVTCAGRANGVQFGGINTADELHGLQVGVYNRARGGAGVQIGLVNGFGPPGDALWLPIVNAHF